MNIKKIKEIIKAKKELIQIGNYDFDTSKEILEQTAKYNPSSEGIKAAFQNGFMQNKPSNIKAGSVYWALNILTPSKKMLDKNTHINICLGYFNDIYIGVHGSTDGNAFSSSTEIQQLINPKSKLQKTYYICTNRVYLFTKRYINKLVVNDYKNRELPKIDYVKIDESLAKNQINNDVDYIYVDIIKDKIFYLFFK